MNRTFLVGIYPGLTRPMLDFLADSIREYMAEAAR
jgi:CDP-6-deoxy-D-xylo-4-hexulose-3-dehydrase